MNKSYCVYCHTNILNNKKYFGITGANKPEYRWHKDGSGYKDQVFGRAIEKYGWNNFKHEIIYKDLTYDNACKKEIELIKKYQTTNSKYGYNKSSGGDCISLGTYNNALSKKVYMYNIDGEFIKEFPSMMEAERETGIDNSAICACCKGRNLYTKDYRWSYKKEESLSPINKEKYLYDSIRKEQCKDVYQYSLDGEFLNKYASLSDACNNTNSDFRLVSACCLGKRNKTNGYIWAYNYYDSFEKLKNRKNDNVKKGKPVFQYDLNNILINSYESIMDAVRKTGYSKTQISNCCNDKTGIVDGKYFFKFNPLYSYI